jgi:hypothetical protein
MNGEDQTLMQKKAGLIFSKTYRTIKKYKIDCF